MTVAAGFAGDEFGRLVRGGRRERVQAPAGRLIGLEHEFVVRSGEKVVDFRELIGQLPLGGRRLDPGDRNAHRLPGGGVVTADGREAEIALAPMVRRPGFAGRVEEEAGRARRNLATALPAGHSLEGYSTHL